MPATRTQAIRFARLHGIYSGQVIIGTHKRKPWYMMVLKYDETGFDAVRQKYDALPCYVI